MKPALQLSLFLSFKGLWAYVRKKKRFGFSIWKKYSSILHFFNKFTIIKTHGPC